MLQSHRNDYEMTSIEPHYAQSKANNPVAALQTCRMLSCKSQLGKLLQYI